MKKSVIMNSDMHQQRRQKRARSNAIRVLQTFSENTEVYFDDVSNILDGNVQVSPSTVKVTPQSFLFPTIPHQHSLDEQTRILLENIVTPLNNLNNVVNDTRSTVNEGIETITSLPIKSKEILRVLFTKLFGEDLQKGRMVAMAVIICYSASRGRRKTRFERMLILCACIYLLYLAVEQEASVIEVFTIISQICFETVHLLFSEYEELADEEDDVPTRREGNGFTVHYENQGDVQPQNGECLSFDVSSVEPLVDLMLSGIGLKNYTTNDKASLFSSIKEVCSMRGNFQKLVLSLFNIIIAFINWVAKRAFGKLNWISKTTGLVEADALISRVDTFVKQSYSGTLSYSRGLVGDVESLRTELSELIRAIPRNEHTSGAISELVTKKNQIETIYQSLIVNPKFKAGYRFETILMFITGAPKTGKSTISNFLASLGVSLTTTREEFEHFVDNQAHYVFQRNAENEYWDGYKPHHRVVKIDDLGQMKDQVGSPYWFEVIRAVNVTPYHLHMSAIEDKKNAYFDSPFIVATSNVPHNMDDFKRFVSSCNYPEAIWRRFSIIIEPLPSEKISDNKGKIDTVKLSQFAKPLPTLWRYKVSGHGLKDEILSWAKLSKFIKGVYDKQLAMFERNVIAQQTLNDYLLSSKSFIGADLPGSEEDSFVSFYDRFKRAFFSNPQPDVIMEQVESSNVVPQAGEEPTEGPMDWLNGYPTELAPSDLADSEYENELFDPIFPPGGFTSNRPDIDVMEILDRKISLQIDYVPVNLHSLITPEDRKEFTPIWNELVRVLDNEDLQLLVSNIKCAMGWHYLIVNDSPFRVLTVYYTKNPRGACTFREVLLKKNLWDVSYFSDYTLPSGKLPSPPPTLLERLKISLGLPTMNLEQWFATVGKLTVGVFTATTAITVIVNTIYGTPKRRKTKPQSTGYLSKARKPRAKINVKERLSQINSVKVKPQNGSDTESESNQYENFNSVIKKNLVQIKLRNEDVIFHYGYALGVKDDLVIFPHHFFPKWCTDHFDDDIIFIRGSLSVTVPMSEFISHRYNKAQWKEKDVMMSSVPSDLGRFKDITSKFALAKDKPVNPVQVQIPLPHARLHYGTMARIANQNITYKISDEEYDTLDILTYPCSTRRGDCGAPIMRTDKRTQQRVILGMHIALDDVKQQAFSAAIYQETLHILYNSYKERSVPSEEVIPQAGIPEFLQRFKILEPHPNGSNHLTGKCNIVPSPLHNCKEWHVPLTAPALLKPTDTVNPWEVSYQKYRQEKVTIDEKLLELAFEDLNIFFEERNTEVVNHRVLTLAEATFGDPENEYLDSIKTSSSVGFPYKKIYPNWKKEIFGSDTFDETTPAYLEYKREVDKIISSAVRGEDPLIVYTENLKSERRPLEKVVSGKSRNFSGASFPFCGVVRMYYFTAGEELIRNRIKNSTTSGVNTYSPEWNEIAETILGFAYSEKGERKCLTFDGDYSAFDANQVVPIMDKCFDYLDSRYPNATAEDKAVRKMIRKNIIYSKHIWRDIIFLVEGGNPSGNPLTTHINNLYNMLAFRYTFYSAVGESKGLFHHNVSLVVGGDDNAGAFSPNIIDVYNMQVVIKEMEKIGCKYTAADKSETNLKYKDFSKITFLKRSFTSYAGGFIGPLDIHSTLEMSQWMKKNRMDIFYTNVATSLRELSLHPKEIFDEKRTVLRKFMKDNSLSTDTLEFQLPHHILRDKVLKMEYYV